MATSLVGEAGGLMVLLTPGGGGRRGRRLDGGLDANGGVGLDSVEKRPVARIWPAVEEAVVDAMEEAASMETGEEASAAEAGQCGGREDGGSEGEVEKRRRQGARMHGKWQNNLSPGERKLFVMGPVFGSDPGV
uniref:Uncharacterized protein n=1 Tax=Oryza glumipatula TaxID=40148 RepID=A0A0E0BHH7_9ORYZ